MSQYKYPPENERDRAPLSVLCVAILYPGNIFIANAEAIVQMTLNKPLNVFKVHTRVHVFFHKVLGVQGLCGFLEI